MVRDKSCIICGHRLSEEPLMVLDNMPASAQNIPDAVGLQEDFGITLALHQCPVCGLAEFDCEPVDYYRDVIRSGGFSTTMVELRRRQYEHLISTYHLEGKKFLEAGCGQGEFLSVLAQFPVRAYGIEHKPELAALAQARGLCVWSQFTETEDTLLSPSAQLGDTIISRQAGESYGPYDVFLSFNFLEHQPHPDVMLKCLYHNLAEGGMGLITVPSLEYILQYDGYYELIHDHLAYYTFETLRTVLNQAGFEVLEEELINRDTLSVIVKKRSPFSVIAAQSEQTFKNVRSQKTAAAAISTQKTAGAAISTQKTAAAAISSQNPAGAAISLKKAASIDVTGLRNSHTLMEAEVRLLLEQIQSKGQTMAIWGASHQGFTLASTTGLGGKVRYMIDSAPFKQGRFAPASHIPIVSPEYFFEDPVDAILIVAPGYTEEIAAIIKERFGKNTEIFTLRSSHIEVII